MAERQKKRDRLLRRLGISTKTSKTSQREKNKQANDSVADVIIE